MKITYAITVNDEYLELKKLINFLLTNKKLYDEIVVLQDFENYLELLDDKAQVYEFLTPLQNKNILKFYNRKLENNFSDQKNYLTSKCTGDYIFQIDADEIPNINIIKTIHDLLELNKNAEVVWVPRINIVDGITEDYLRTWNWDINEQGWINFPDYQSRIYKNIPVRIYWKRAVHESLVGYKYFINLPKMKEWSLIHKKKLNKQINQNLKYNQILK